MGSGLPRFLIDAVRNDAKSKVVAWMVGDTLMWERLSVTDLETRPYGGVSGHSAEVRREDGEKAGLESITATGGKMGIVEERSH